MSTLDDTIEILTLISHIRAIAEHPNYFGAETSSWGDRASNFWHQISEIAAKNAVKATVKDKELGVE